MENPTLLFITMAIVIITGLLIGGRMNSKQDAIDLERKEIETLKTALTKLKNEINFILANHPEIKPDAKIEGTNTTKHIDKITIQRLSDDITLPLETPSIMKTDSKGNQYDRKLNYIKITVTGTKSHYQIIGNSAYEKGKTGQVTYDSKSNQLQEQLLTN